MGCDDYIQFQPFSTINLDDHFFNSLRQSYSNFDDWFQHKSLLGEKAYFAFDSKGHLIAMLYLKKESGIEEEITPLMDFPRLKVGTFKVDFEHHTGIGKRLLAIALREFAESGLSCIYVTMHDNDQTVLLATLLKKYGFVRWGSKKHESVYIKQSTPRIDSNIFSRYPFISRSSGNCWILSIMPPFHRKLFGDVNLTSEFGQPKIDERCLNSIEKIYLSASSNAAQMMEGDKVLIYRTTDIPGKAYYRSVVTSVCTVTRVVNLERFNNEADFLTRLSGKSVFSQDELEKYWRTRKYPWLLFLLFNFPLKRYPNRKQLLDNGLIDNGRLVCEQISQHAMDDILRLGNVNEGYIVD